MLAIPTLRRRTQLLLALAIAVPVFGTTAWAAPGARVAVGTVPTAADYPVLGSSGDITGDGVPDLWGRACDDTVTGWPGVSDGAGWTGAGAAFTIAGA
ncbi:hypothetical protein OG900_29150 [Streptomyces sp. NBC_00433]